MSKPCSAGWNGTSWRWRDFVLRPAVNFSISSSPNWNIVNTLIPPEFVPCASLLRGNATSCLALPRCLTISSKKIAQRFQVPDYQVRALCLLQRKPKTSQAYWMGRDQLNQQLAWKFHAVWGG